MRERERKSREDQKHVRSKLRCSMGTIPHCIGLWVHGVLCMKRPSLEIKPKYKIRVVIHFQLDFCLFAYFWDFLMLFMESNPP